MLTEEERRLYPIQGELYKMREVHPDPIIHQAKLLYKSGSDENYAVIELGTVFPDYEASSRERFEVLRVVEYEGDPWVIFRTAKPDVECWAIARKVTADEHEALKRHVLQSRNRALVGTYMAYEESVRNFCEQCTFLYALLPTELRAFLFSQEGGTDRLVRRILENGGSCRGRYVTIDLKNAEERFQRIKEIWQGRIDLHVEKTNPHVITVTYSLSAKE